MRFLAIRNKTRQSRRTKKRLGPLMFKIVLSVAAVIYAVYTVSQIAAFILRDI